MDSKDFRTEKIENVLESREYVKTASSPDRDQEILLPRPSDDPNDPLNWPIWLKISCLIQVCLLALAGGFNTAIINPAYVPMAKEFGITKIYASYQTTVVIALNGVGPFLWIPLANVYGRRPIYLFTTLLGFGAALGSAYAKNYAQLIVARVFTGLFPVAMGLGPATVVDLFFLHQRGRALGLFTVILTTGSHIAPIVGGAAAQYLGWRWTFKLSAIFDAFLFIMVLLGLPETLYIRDPARLLEPTTQPPSLSLTPLTYLSLLKPYTPFPALKLHWNQFIWPSLRMAKYPSVLFPALYYSAQYGFASILPAVTTSAIFSSRFGWTPLQIGCAYGTSLTIGALLGELSAGLVLDAILKRSRRTHHGASPPPEVRLKAIWTGAILVPVGLIIYGCTLQYGDESTWIAPLIGMAVACFGAQSVTTCCYTYAIDCYQEQSGEVANLFNFVRQVFGMTFAFYVVRLCEEIGYQWVFVLFAGLGGLGALPVVWLMWK